MVNISLFLCKGNSLKLSFTNIWGLLSNFLDWIFPWIKISWHCCSTWDKLRWLNWFWQFLCDVLSSSNLKRILLLICIILEGKTSFCTGLISSKLRRFFLTLWLALLHSVFYFFFLHESPSSSLWSFLLYFIQR